MPPITRKSIEQVDPPRSPREILPTMYDLPSEDLEEPGLPDEFHDLQPQLLSRTLRLSHYSSENCFTASDLNLYYEVNQPQWYKRPDWFLAIGVPRLYDGKDLRRSYVLWQEGRAPYIVIEFLSPGTEAEDLGRFYPYPLPPIEAEDTEQERPPGKLVVYEQYLRVPHYIVFDRHSQTLRYFKLEGGRYQEEALHQFSPLIWLSDLEIGLSIWQGVFEGVSGNWLRWCDQQGNWLLTDTEAERRIRQQAEQQVEQERSAKEQAQAQLLQAARNLLDTGMSLDQVIALLNLSEAQVQRLRSS